jgi:Pyocin activator protein PrtN
MKTILMLMAKHDGAAVISADTCCKEYFAPLTLTVFMRKVGNGEIDLPVARMEASQKGARMVHLQDLADYIDRQRDAAAKELKAMRA